MKTSGRRQYEQGTAQTRPGKGPEKFPEMEKKKKEGVISFM